MSNFRKLCFLHDGDYFSFENKIYKVDWGLDEPNNAIHLKTGTYSYIDETIRVKWLKNYEKLTLV